MTTEENLEALFNLNGQICDRLNDCMGTDETVIDLDNSSSQVHGKQEEGNYNGYFKCNCYHPLFAFN